MPKQKRKAVWRECLWCRARGIDPPVRMGKAKPLMRHMVECEACYRLEKESSSKPKIDVVLSMVKRQQSQIADLSARVSSLEARKARVVDPSNFWDTQTPRQCWRNRKQNCKRFMQAVLKSYVPKPYLENRMSWFEWFFPSEGVCIQDILMAALWPILESRDDKTCIRGIETEDMYCLFKQIWSKQRAEGTDLNWYIECLNEIGAPCDIPTIQKEAAEFDRALLKFQLTTKRAGSGSVAHGLIPLVRIWRRFAHHGDDILMVARSLPPTEELTWGTQEPPDLSSSESTATRVDSKSVLGHQSSTEIPPDYVGVQFS